MTKVEVLYFEGCPNHAPVKEMVRRVLEHRFSAKHHPAR